RTVDLPVDHQNSWRTPVGHRLSTTRDSFSVYDPCSKGLSSGWSAYGPSRHFAAKQRFDRFRVQANIKWHVGPAAQSITSQKSDTHRDVLAGHRSASARPPPHGILAISTRRLRSQQWASSLSTRGCHTAITSKPGTAIGDLSTASRLSLSRNRRDGTSAIRSSVCNISGASRKLDTEYRTLRRSFRRASA